MHGGGPRHYPRRPGPRPGGPHSFPHQNLQAPPNLLPAQPAAPPLALALPADMGLLNTQRSALVVFRIALETFLVTTLARNGEPVRARCPPSRRPPGPPARPSCPLTPESLRATHTSQPRPNS